MKKLFLPLLTMAILSGCSAFSKQHNEYHADYQNISSAEDAVISAEKFKTRKKTTRILHLQEQARLYHIAGDYAKSRKKMAEALDFYRESDYDAIINTSRLGAKAAALATNDKVIPYIGSDYERIYARQMQAMNYLGLGDVNGAMVEIRAAANEQRFAAEARAERIDEAVDKKQKKLMKFVDKEQLGVLKTLVGDERNGFLNSYMYYFSALLREATGDSNGAYIDYQKAWQLVTPNRYVGNHVVRLADRYDKGNQPRYQELLTTTANTGYNGISGNEKPEAIPEGSGRVAVLVERGFVQPRQELIFDVQFDYISVTGQYRFVWSRAAIPYYDKDDFYFLSPVTVSSGDVETRSQFMMSSVSLAANQLQEVMPSIMFRQWARIISKHIVSDVALNAMVSGGDEAGLIIGLAVALAIKGVVILLEQADTRSWLSIPAQIDNAELILPAGKQEITITLADGRFVTTEADVIDGGITIIRLFDNGNFTTTDQLYPAK